MMWLQKKGNGLLDRMIRSKVYKSFRFYLALVKRRHIQSRSGTDSEKQCKDWKLNQGIETKALEENGAVFSLWGGGEKIVFFSYLKECLTKGWDLLSVLTQLI